MLFRATSLKFIADEYSTQIGLKGIYDYLQDVTAGTGLHMIPGTQGLVGWIDESWKRGNVAQKAVTQVHAGRHDLGPANINLITALNYMGYNFSSSKSRKINDVAKSLTTDAGTVNLTINFVLDAMVDLKGHFCCGYSRRNTELLVSWLREGGKHFWNRAGGSSRRNLSPEQMALWRDNSSNLPDVVPLDPGELDPDKFRFIEKYIK